MSDQEAAGITRLVGAEHRPLELQDRTEAPVRPVDGRYRSSFAPDTEAADLSLPDASLERGQELVAQITDGRFVQKQDIDVVGPQRGEASIDGSPQVVRRETRPAGEATRGAGQPGFDAG